jgi:predicted phage replisome organizer
VIDVSDVKWIKITTSMFDDEKIKIIDSMPERDTVLVIWLKLLILAGKCNAGGLIFVTEGMPYTDETLAAVVNRPLNTVRLTLDVLQKLKMIAIDESGIDIVNWEKHQSADKLKELKEQNRKRQKRYYEKHKQKELASNNGNSNDNSNVRLTLGLTSSNAVDIDIDKERDIEEDKSSSRQKSDEAQRIPYQKIVDLYHSICVSLPHVRALSTTRKSQIRSRWKENPDFKYWKDFFERVEHSDFLTGRVERRDGRSPFIADLQWITKQENHLKIMEGKYDNREEVMNADNREIIENIRRLAAKQRNANGS